MDVNMAFVSGGFGVALASSRGSHGVGLERRWKVVMSGKKRGGGGGSRKPPANERLSVRGFGGGASLGSKKKKAKGTKDEVVAPEFLRDVHTEAFYQWLRRGGASFGRVALGRLNGIRGLFALQPFETGEVICSLPKPLSLVLGTESNDPIRPATRLINMLSSTDSEAYRTFKPMFDTLPTSQEADSPMFFTDEELLALDHTSVVEDVRRQKEKIASHFRSLQEAVPNGEGANSSPGFTEQDLLWATFVVYSRAISIQNEDRGFDKTLVPLIDMANYRKDAKHYMKVHNGQYALIAGEDIQAGEEIFQLYGGGKLSNYHLLMDYGMVVEDNHNDLIRLLGGGTSKIKAGQEKALADALEQRLDSLKYTEADDQAALQADASYRAKMIVLFRRENRRSLAKAIELLRAE